MKMAQLKKWMNRGGQKVKRKSQDFCVGFKPQTYLEILLCTHAWTMEVNIIMQLVEKAMKTVYDL